MELNVLEQATQNLISINIYSKLLQNNIIFINEPICTRTVSDYQSQLLYLQSLGTKKINIYINSPGGSIYDCLGLYDLIQNLKAKGIIIKTINVGLAASAAAVLLLSGSEGYRESLPNCRILLHQPSSETYGTITDMAIELTECQELKKILNNIIEKHTCKEVLNHIERDFWLDANKAKELKVIDKILC